MKTRRDFLQQLFVTGGSIATLGLLLTACGNSADTEKAKTKPEIDSAKKPVDDGSVTEADLAKRQQLGYVEHTPMEDSYCANCALYLAPTDERKFPGCQLFKGEVNPNGYCTYWAAPQQH